MYHAKKAFVDDTSDVGRERTQLRCELTLEDVALEQRVDLGLDDCSRFLVALRTGNAQGDAGKLSVANDRKWPGT